MSRILITGGTGFIGSHLAAACLDAGDEVHLLVRPGSSGHRLRRLTGRLVRHEVDMSADGNLRRVLNDVQPEVLYHLAVTPRRRETPDLADVRAGIEEDLNLLIALLSAAACSCRPPSVMVRAGSLAEYGLAPLPYRESVREQPVTAYGAGLVAGTHYVTAVRARLPFPVVTARLALVYGPTQCSDFLVPRLIERCLAGQQTLVKRPADRRDLMYVSDAVDALRMIARSNLKGGTILNVATGIAPSMRHVARLVVRKTGVDSGLVTFGEDFEPSGVPDLRGATYEMLQRTGWRARVLIAEGIARTVAWYRAQRPDFEPVLHTRRAELLRPVAEGHSNGR